MNETLQIIKSFLPTVLIVIATVLVLWTVIVFFRKRPDVSSRFAFGRGVTFVVIIVLGIILAILALPVSDSLRNNLLTVVGIVISAAITLSSTTFVGNAMAGFMLRSMQQFRTGDFIKVEKHFGRISEHSLLHTEIQTEDSNLTTLPNLFLVNHPMTVIRSTGTIISTEISLGYDVSREEIERVLIDAATEAGLKDPFVRILQLGDFSVNYSVWGFLEDPKHIISAESGLRAKILDHMHRNNIEIVSPTFMNQRQLSEDRVFIPKDSKRRIIEKVKDTPEEKIFDKAEQAAGLEALKLRLEKIKAEASEMAKTLKETEDKGIALRIENQLKLIAEEQSQLESRIKEVEELIKKQAE